MKHIIGKVYYIEQGVIKIYIILYTISLFLLEYALSQAIVSQGIFLWSIKKIEKLSTRLNIRNFLNEVKSIKKIVYRGFSTIKIRILINSK